MVARGGRLLQEGSRVQGQLHRCREERLGRKIVSLSQSSRRCLEQNLTFRNIFGILVMFQIPPPPTRLTHLRALSSPTQAAHSELLLLSCSVQAVPPPTHSCCSQGSRPGPGIWRNIRKYFRPTLLSFLSLSRIRIFRTLS